MVTHPSKAQIALLGILITLFVSSFPILLLLAVWVIFMRSYVRRNAPVIEAQKQMPEYMRRHLEISERIAQALERIAAAKGS